MSKPRIRLIGIVFVLIGVLLMSACGGPAAADGDIVKVHYTGTLDDGSVFDSSVGKSPLEFELGAGNMIVGFENAVRGMKAGETKTFTIPAAEAYGEYVPGQVQMIPAASIPPGLNPEVGMRLEMTLQDGSSIPMTVTEVTDEGITVDLNHPLAGKDLTFEIELVSIN